MGGTIFTKPTGAEPALSCPRMPPDVYSATKAAAATALRTVFKHVSTPPEAPGKPDHGDVDFHVLGSVAGAELTHDALSDLVPSLVGALHARRWVARGAGQYSFAVPWQRAETQRSLNGDGERDAKQPRLAADADAAADHYAQLDMTLCGSLAELRWITWLHGYGDATQILAMTLRGRHLVFHPLAGLVLRDPELGRLDRYTPVDKMPSRRAQSDFPLSRDPDDVMRFLGLDGEAYHAGIESEGALFRWIVASPYVSREAFTRKDEGEVVEQDDVGAISERDASPDPQTVHEGNARTRASDRRRRDKRHMYVRFSDEFLKENPETATGPQPSQEEAASRALEFFGKREDYEARVASIRAVQVENKFWMDVKERIPKTSRSLNEAVRGLRRYTQFQVVDGKTLPKVADAAELDPAKHPSWTASGMATDELIQWVDSHWEECKAKESHRARTEAESRKAARNADTSHEA